MATPLSNGGNVKRILKALLLLATLPAYGQLGTAGQQEYARALTNGGRFGAPRYTTTNRPTCNTSNLAGLIWNTTTSELQQCNGSAWAAAVGGSVFPTGGVFGAAAAGAANAIEVGVLANNICFEGATADAFETCITVADPTVGDQTWTIPNAAAAVSRTFASLEAAQSFTATNTFSNVAAAAIAIPTGANIAFPGNSSGGVIGQRSETTPDTLSIMFGATSNSLSFYEIADFNFDFNNGRCLTAACTNPSLIIHSPDQVVTEYVQIQADATGAGHVQSNLAEITVGGFKTAITEASDVPIVRFGLPTSTNVFGATVTYTVYDINGSNYVARTGLVKIQGGNASGTVLCTVNTAQDAESEDGSQIVTSNAYTLTYTWTQATSTTNCDLRLNAASSAGVNTYAITWTAVFNGNSNAITVTAQ